jgi:hypothetical protein
MQEAPWQPAVDSTRRRVLSAYDDGYGRIMAIVTESRRDENRWAKSKIDSTMGRVNAELARMQERIISALDKGATAASKGAGGKSPGIADDSDRVKAQIGKMRGDIRAALTSESREINNTAAALKISKKESAKSKRDSHISRAVSTKFSNRNGANVDSRVYFDVLATASANNAGLAVFEEETAKSGHDLVVVSGPRSGCPKCRPWIGKTLSISGTDPSHKSIDEAKAAGLFHPRCRHFLKIKKEEKEGDE